MSSLSRREFERVRVVLRAEVSPEGGDARGARVENLSLGGAFLAVETPDPMPVGALCGVSILLDGVAQAIVARGRVVRVGPDGCGVEFVEIVGVDSFAHLRNILLFNAQDPDVVERQFLEHVGLHRP